MVISGKFCPKLTAMILHVLAAILLQFLKLKIAGLTYCRNCYQFWNLEKGSKIVATRVNIETVIFGQNLPKMAIVQYYMYEKKKEIHANLGFAIHLIHF